MVRNHTNQDFFAHEEITITRDLVKMWFDISGADIIQSYLIEKIRGKESMRQSKRTERVSPDGMHCCRT